MHENKTFHFYKNYSNKKLILCSFSKKTLYLSLINLFISYWKRFYTTEYIRRIERRNNLPEIRCPLCSTIVKGEKLR